MGDGTRGVGMVSIKHDQPLSEAARKLMITRNDQPITILLVDDDPDCRLLIRDAIAECKVSNEQEALDFLNRRGKFANAPRPGLVYLDIEMPAMDGQATLKAIKASPA